MCALVDTLRRVVLLLLLAACVSALRAEAAVARRSYDIPAGDAEATLRRYVEQSGEQVFYVVPKVRGVRTNRVRGEFSAREAIDRMLADTALVVVEDGRTGALTINRAPPSPPARAPTQPDTSSAAPPSKTMKTKHPLALLAGWLSLALTPLPAAHAAEAGSAGTIEGRVLNATSGDYLKKARVVVEGTTLASLSGDFGEYRLAGVPAGVVRLRAVYPDLPAQVVTVNVAGGQTVRQDIELRAPAGGPAGDTIVMDAFTVAARRETEGRIIAINEQRYAADIRNVVSSDEFGDVTEGNVGEFMKFIPGVIVDYGAANARTVSVRGLPPSTTPVSIDGNPVASAASSATTRTFEFEQVSINNVSRVEVAKTATPDRSADSLGGSVNMVSKSAFERAKPQFNTRAYLSINDTATRLGKSPSGPDGESRRLIRPGFDFTYVRPVNERFGFVVTGLFSDQYNPAMLSQANWYPLSGSLPAGSPPTVTGDTPYMGTYRFQIQPSHTIRRSVGLTADWRLTPRDVFSLTAQYSEFDSYFYIYNYTFDTVLAGTFGPTFTNGAANRGNFYTTTNWRHKVGAMWQPNFTYRHTGEVWKIEAGGFHSHSANRYRDIDDGFFNYVTAGIEGTTVNFRDLSPDRPGTIEVLRNGVPVDPFNLANLQIITTATSRNFTGYQGQLASNQNRAADTKRGARAHLRRDFDWRVPVLLKLGADYRQNQRDIRSNVRVWRFNGADGVYISGDEPAAPYLNSTYSTTAAPYGFGRVQWLDAREMYDRFQTSPGQFSEVLTGTFGSIIQSASGSRYIDEAVTAGYLRGDTRLFRDRLLLVAGARYERTQDKGQGLLRDTNAIYQRDAGGRLVRDAAGRTILLTNDAAEQTLLQYQDRGARVARTYDGWYPSVNGTFKFTESLLARASWARTMGRPDFGNIIPSTVVPDLSTTSRVITVNNTGLKPWQADNYDLALEYYFPGNGLASVSLFRKDFTNFFGTVTSVASPQMLESYGLDPDLFAGYSITTRANVGTARVTGLELNYSQKLDFLPFWARGLSVFANGTSLHLQGPAVADFNAFVRRNANWGLSLNRPRYTIMLKWVQRADQRLGLRTTTGSPPANYQWLKGTLKLDVNAEYRLRRGLALFVNGRNVTNEPYVLEWHNETTPGYARQYSTQEFGIQWAVGLKGSY